MPGVGVLGLEAFVFGDGVGQKVNSTFGSGE